MTFWNKHSLIHFHSKTSKSIMSCPPPPPPTLVPFSLPMVQHYRLVTLSPPSQTIPHVSLPPPPHTHTQTKLPNILPDSLPRTQSPPFPLSRTPAKVCTNIKLCSSYVYFDNSCNFRSFKNFLLISHLGKYLVFSTCLVLELLGI